MEGQGWRSDLVEMGARGQEGALGSAQRVFASGGMALVTKAVGRERYWLIVRLLQIITLSRILAEGTHRPDATPAVVYRARISCGTPFAGAKSSLYPDGMRVLHLHQSALGVHLEMGALTADRMCRDA